MGLKYEAVEKAFALEPPADREGRWWALRVLEAEAVRLRNEHANSR
jgi:hypothetical protein